MSDSAPRRLVLRAPVAEEVLSHARSALPHEACGLLAGRLAEGLVTAFHPTRNEHASALRFSVHPEDLVHVMLGIENRGDDLVAIFHSHVSSPAVPSATDVREARYPLALHVLASMAEAHAGSRPGLRAWRIGDRQAFEVPIVIG